MDYYIGEIRIFAGVYAPEDWRICDGSLLPISGNEALYSLLGVTYGGNGTVNFGIPDLRGRLNVCSGQGTGLTPRSQGQTGGTEEAVLTTPNLPVHTHSLNTAGASVTATTPIAGPTVAFANTTGQNAMYLESGVTGATQPSPNSATIGNNGGGANHPNVMPCLAVNYIICVTGLYPAGQ